MGAGVSWKKPAALPIESGAAGVNVQTNRKRALRKDVPCGSINFVPFLAGQIDLCGLRAIL